MMKNKMNNADISRMNLRKKRNAYRFLRFYSNRFFTHSRHPLR